MVKKKIFLLGSSRLHRPFCKRDNGVVTNNIEPHIDVLFPRIGYFHSVQEIIQIIQWVKSNFQIPGSVAPYIFRKEAPESTPLNEFDYLLGRSLLAGTPPSPPNIDLNDVDYFIFEISAKNFIFHEDAGFFLHLNPNLAPETLGKKAIAWGDWLRLVNFSCVKGQLSADDMVKYIGVLAELLPREKIIIVGHLHEKNTPNAVRFDLNTDLRLACLSNDLQYFDTTPYVEKYGFRLIGDVKDLFHLSHEGEKAFARDIQFVCS